MADSIENRILKLPQIQPSSYSTINTDRPPNTKIDTHSYDQWRANIHRDLEEDLQRQVHELLDETEQQERLNKLRLQYLRAGQRLPFQQSEINIPQGVPWSEIDRRNRNVLYPYNSKDSCESQDYFSTLNHQRNNTLNNSFDLESCNSHYRRQRRFSQPNNDYLLNNSTFHFQKLQDKRSTFASSNNDSSLLYGNSIVKSNKADILNLLEQKSINNSDKNTFVNKHGVIISEDGPFWPCDHRILHATPKLFSQEMTLKEFYFATNESSLSRK